MSTTKPAVDSEEPQTNASRPERTTKVAVRRAKPGTPLSRRTFSVRLTQLHSLDSGGEAIAYIRRADDLPAALAAGDLKLSDGVFEVVGELLAEIVRKEEHDEHGHNILERGTS